MTEPIAEQVTLTINDQEITVPAGTLVVDAASALNIEIPIFCSHPKLDPVACCRMCLVEVTGPRGPQLMTACSVPVTEGMVVDTRTEQVLATQKANLAFILMNHPLDCPICDKGGECPLQDQTMRFGPGVSELVEAKRRKKKHYNISDTIVLDQERCIVCWRCIRYLEEWEDKPQLELFERGGETIIDIQPGKPVDAKTSGNIIDICPVGALTNQVARFDYRPWEIEKTPSICNHCSIGCNLRLDTRTHRLRRIVGRENPLVNDQWLCDKGRFAHAWVNHEERLKMPLMRKDGNLVAVPWSEALQYVVDTLETIRQQHGADAIGGIGSAKLSNESNYLLQRFMRQLIGTNNVDHRDGSAVAALPTGLPSLSSIMKPQYGPDPEYDCVLLFGIDPSEELPILDLHLKRSVNRASMKLIIAHPRRIELTRYGGPYLSYLPGSEASLLAELTKATQSVATTSADSDRDTTNSGSTSSTVESGIDQDAIREAGATLAASERTLIIYGPMAARGEGGPDVVAGLSRLAEVTDSLEDLAYVGLESNSQGVRDMGVLPNQLPGYRSVDDDEARKHIGQTWRAELPAVVGKSYEKMLDEAGSELRALFIMGADPASERSHWATNLGKLELLVVQELFLTETAKMADVVLPAVSWAECDGTFTNLERRVQRSRKALANQQSKAAPDWLIFDHLATRMGVNWPYADVQSVTEEISQLIPFYNGLDWDELGDLGIQWDASSVQHEMDVESIEPTALPEKQRSFTLIGGTALYDGGNLFYLTEIMRDMAYLGIFMNPDDADRISVTDGQLVEITSDVGTAQLAVRRSNQIQPGTVWIPESQRGVALGDLTAGADNVTVDIQVVHTSDDPEMDSRQQVVTSAEQR